MTVANLYRKQKIIHDWVGKAIHLELCKRLHFDQGEWYMHRTLSILNNEMDKILCTFEIQTDHLIQARTTDMKLVKKNNMPDFESRCSV